MRRLLIVAGGALAAAGAVAVLALADDDDRQVDPASAAARRAAAAAREIVPGRVLGVYRDADDGRWEVAVRQAGHVFEVELLPGTLAPAGIDYD